ncbi:imidazole glycerol phosphate synthase subunit HisH [Flavobacterium urumqiense]|uniref:Imidazole glycerol phosphate synthase subunit HisH n=1 Tax=Flavobacterium urumqiense TaxID=935224 RepID=A0A1H5W9F7_9FLAO|nr:imidazole glycerol phosphate synthase subunit HisH [Flavobacterium urumqiense]SEF96075.1 glutamine amidotransferase [Flavobacterium urumqiense]
MKIVIINYGAGNIQSIMFAIERLGFKAVLSNNPDEIKAADKVIFPGVGEASSAMKMLLESGLETLIPNLKQPVLGICLGMQLMCNKSEEGNTKGLGIFDVDVIKFTPKLKVPQMGWNQIYNLKSPLFEGINENEYMYLVHSFYAPNCPEAIATTDYDVEYASALQKHNFYGTQFHPEKSGDVGEQILANFLKLKD